MCLCPSTGSESTSNRRSNLNLAASSFAFRKPSEKAPTPAKRPTTVSRVSIFCYFAVKISSNRNTFKRHCLGIILEIAPDFDFAFRAKRHAFDAAGLQFRVEPRKIVELQRDGLGRSAEELGEFNNLRRAAVLGAKRNLAVK